MNEHALFHEMDSAYCFPVSDNKITLRLRTARNDIKNAYVLYESKYVIGKRHKKKLMDLKYQTALFDFYEVTLTLKDTRLAYVFYVDDGRECFYFSEDGATKEYNFKLGYYNFFQYAYINASDVIKPVEWMKTAFFYQIFVDRFNMGRKDKDTSYINCKWGDIPTPKTFAGGDLKGIEDKLEYIKSLGVNAIYLTPVFKSLSNHKYDISDYYMVDPMFGTNEDLKSLIKKAHSLGIRIVLDAVFNHCSDQMQEFRDVVSKGKESPYYDWFFVHGDRPVKKPLNYETFASCAYMPKLNTNNPKVREYLINIATHYIKEYDIDGWRLDVSDEISQSFWREFRTACKKAKDSCVIIGENWHNAYQNLRGDQYDGIMNYAFTKAALDYFAFGTKEAEDIANKLNEILTRNKTPINDNMLNLLDSHDTYRFLTEVKGDKEKLKAAIALLFFFKGSPCIFYGTECYTEGGYDPDCRRCMDFERVKKNRGCDDILLLIKTLSKLLKTPSFAYADVKISSESGVLKVERINGKCAYMLLINETDNKESCCNDIGVDRHSFKILKNGRTIING